MIAMYFAVRSGLKPLEKFAQELQDNDVSKLHAIHGHENVKELKPLVDALNQLMKNMQDQLEKERSFLNTCTHELRTPVAGLVAQIQSHAGNSNQPPLHQTIKLAADRTIRVANQFLSLAKSNNAEAFANNATVFDLTELIRQISADILMQYQNVNCKLTGVPSLQVNADALAMEMLIRNLLENACKHGKAIGTDHVDVLIGLQQFDSFCQLTVEDSGDGVAASEFADLTKRFYRSHPTHDSIGAGLGLSIVEEVAQRYSGTVVIDSSEQLGCCSAFGVRSGTFRSSSKR